MNSRADTPVAARESLCLHERRTRVVGLGWPIIYSRAKEGGNIFIFLRREVGARRERWNPGPLSVLAARRPRVCVIRDAPSNYKTRSLWVEIPFVISGWAARNISGKCKRMCAR